MQLDTTTGMQSSDTATGVRMNCLYSIFSQKWNARNKQTSFAFSFGEDLSYFVILPYKLREGDFQKTLLLFHIGRKRFVEYK